MTPLRSQSNSALALVYGMAITTKDSALPVGMLSGLYDELTRRGLMPDLAAVLGPARVEGLELRVAIDRSRVRRGERRR